MSNNAKEQNAYDAAGNRTSMTAVQQSSPNPVSVTSNYSYDPIYELTQAVVGGTLAESYSYDAVGNRLTSAGATSYTYNTSNELTSTSAATYAYDNNGNRMSKTDSTGTTYYTWDFENRLTSVTLPGTGGTAYFKYDPFGRRIEKASSAGTMVYAYDGASITEELGGGGNLLAHYTQGVGIDEPLAMTGTGRNYFYHADGLGSITSLTDGSGQVAASYVYDSFGKPTASTGDIINPFHYTGREFDSETGLYYYRARYYDPSGGRFLTEDPLRFRSSINFYPYVSNSPVDLNDPTGQFIPSWHRDMTYALALAILSSKCQSKAAAIADADASVDDLNYGIGWGPLGSMYGSLQFAFHGGRAWAQPGPHFPSGDMLQQAHDRAMQSCSLTALGEGLHSLQDSYAHSGWDSFSHYWHGTTPDTMAAQSAVSDNAMMATASWLREFKEKCLGCCK